MLGHKHVGNTILDVVDMLTVVAYHFPLLDMCLEKKMSVTRALSLSLYARLLTSSIKLWTPFKNASFSAGFSGTCVGTLLMPSYQKDKVSYRIDIMTWLYLNSSVD